MSRWHPRRRIEVVAGIGRGKTPISAFDDALWRAGVANYNLIELSSIIPPESDVIGVDRCERPPDEFGHRLYVVEAEARAEEPGTIVAAGIGWAQFGDGRGCFVEHGLTVPSGCCTAAESAVRQELETALRDLLAIRDVALAETDIQTRIAVARVEAQATSALVLAVFEAEGWT